MQKIHAYLTLMVGLMSLAVAAGAAHAQDVVKIGVTGPFSGSAAQTGLALRQGMAVAAEEWNAKGGVTVDGKVNKIELLFEDTQNDPAQGVSAARKLITDDRVNFLIGDAFASSVTVAEMDLADEYKVPMMSCEPASAVITEKIEKNPEKYQYFWKADFGTDGYAATIHDTYAALIAGKMLAPLKKTIAFIVEDTDYGRSIAALTADLFKRSGWKVVANDTVPVGSTNFNPVLIKLGYESPDVLVSVFSSADSGVAFSKQFVEQGLKASRFGIYYPIRPTYVKGAGSAAEGLMWAPLIFDATLRPANKPLDEKVRAKFNVPATTDHAYGYDCMNVVLNAFKSVGSVKPDAVVKALAATDHEGTLGRFVFNQKSHTVQYGPKFIPIPTAQIRDGKNVIIWPETVASGKYQTPSSMK